MNKALPVLLASLIGAAAIAQTSAGSGALAGSGSDSASTSGSLSGSTSSNTNTATSNNANLNNNTNTNTNSVNVYGPGSNKLARQQAGRTTTQPSDSVSVMPNGRRAEQRDTRTAQNKACPPGLAKKNNDCLPPGQAKKDDTRTMGNTGAATAEHERRRHTVR
jgi:hypothetical protein